MRKLPILFSGLMVRAILEGRKTQTRRILTGLCDDEPAIVESGEVRAFNENGSPYRWPRTHAVGDLLWVREAWRCDPNGRESDGSIWVVYAAARTAQVRFMSPAEWKLPKRANNGMVPSIHMPRWASRITLRVTCVKVERLQDISEADARAEGIFARGGTGDDPTSSQWTWQKEGWRYDTPRQALQKLWESINGPGSWEANPWVAAYTFEPILQNIDKVTA